MPAALAFIVLGSMLITLSADMWVHGFENSLVNQGLRGATTSGFLSSLSLTARFHPSVRWAVTRQVAIAIAGAVVLFAVSQVVGYVTWFSLVVGISLAGSTFVASFLTLPAPHQSRDRLLFELRALGAVGFGATVCLIGARLGGEAIATLAPTRVNVEANAVLTPDANTLGQVKWCQVLGQSGEACANNTSGYNDQEVLVDFWTSATPVPGVKRLRPEYTALWQSQPDATRSTVDFRNWGQYVAETGSSSPSLADWLRQIDAGQPQAPIVRITPVPEVGVAFALRSVAVHEAGDTGGELGAVISYAGVSGTPTPDIQSPWLFARDKNTGRLYPSAAPISDESGGLIGVMKFGSDQRVGTSPERYAIDIFVVTSSAKEQLQRYLLDRARDQQWSQGLDSPPDGATKVASWESTR